MGEDGRVLGSAGEHDLRGHGGGAVRQSPAELLSRKRGSEMTVRDAYPGPAPFQDTNAHRFLFHGREDEKRTLLQLTLAENFVLVFGRSGMGKTSLINAGLLEPLRQMDYFPVVVRVIHDEKNGPISSVLARFRE